MDFLHRYDRNGIFQEGEQNLLASKRAVVAGCGGLGGYVIEMLARAGVGCIVAVDGDSFCESNLNRQILSKESNLQTEKAKAAARRVGEINSQVEIIPVCTYISRENGREILKGCDVAVDCLDSAAAKLMMHDICKELEIPMIHGAIDGWFGQVSTVYPEDETLAAVYEMKREISETMGNPSFTPAAVASVQTSEVLKVILGRGELLRKKILFMDLYYGDFQIVEV